MTRAGTAPETRLAVAAAAVVVLAHIVISWGYLTIPWGDNGRWLYEIDRMAHGAVPYRDVYWPFPPLAAWVVGGLARGLGSDLTSIWSITATIAGVIAVTYGAIVARLVPGRLAVPVAATGTVLGVAFANQESAPLALGMYTPAVPVAVTCLLLQLLAFLRDWERPRIGTAALVGALGGAGLLAKHDVWVPCVWLALAAAVLTPDSSRARMVRAGAVAGGFILAVGSGVGALTATVGAGAVGDVFAGFGQMSELYGVNLPNLSQLTVEIATFGLAAAAAAAIGRLTRFWPGSAAAALVVAGGLTVSLAAMSLWLWEAELIGRSLLATGQPKVPTVLQQALWPVDPTAWGRLRDNVAVLRFQLLRHLVPALLPMTVLGLALARRRAVSDQRAWRLLLILLIACIALRSRRMISFTEWSQLMLEIAVYGFALRLLWSRSDRTVARAVWLGCGVLMAAGLYGHWRIGRGFGSQRGIQPAYRTARGTIRVAPGLARELSFVRSAADRADPTGERPLFAFHYNSGFSYLLGRPSAGSLTHGFRMSLHPSPDSAYRAVLAEKARLILIDRVPAFRSVQSTDFAPWRWEARMVEDHYARIDRPLFDRLESGCAPVTAPGPRSAVFFVLDCARAGRPGS